MASLALLGWFNDVKTNERQMLDYVRKSFVHARHSGEEEPANGHYNCNELLEHFPEWEDLLRKMKNRFEEFVNFVDEVYRKTQEESRGDRGVFAKLAKKWFCASVIFEFRDKQITNTRSYFSYCQLRKLLVLMNKYEEWKLKQ